MSNDKSFKNWLSGMDSNHDKSLQRALCYRYTTGQTVSGRTIEPQQQLANLKYFSVRLNTFEQAPDEAVTHAPDLLEL